MSHLLYILLSMINVPKPLREEVKRLMNELEAKPLENLSEEQVLHRVQRLEELFGIYGIEPLKDYHKRLERFLDIASEYFSFVGPDRKVMDERAKNRIERKRDYTGMSGKTLVRLKGFLDHVFLKEFIGEALNCRGNSTEKEDWI